MPFDDSQKKWLTMLLAGAVASGSGGGVCREGDDSTTLVTAEAGAAGRNTMVDTQVGRVRQAATDQPGTNYKGDVFRSVDPAFADTYNDHSFSQGGRYNKAGTSALYTSPTVADVQAEARNYGTPADPTGIEGRALVRSEFEGTLLDARSLPGVKPEALTEPWGYKGQERSLLSKVTGEDPYTMPRAVADVAQSRKMGGVIAPANEGNVNIPLFPDPDAPAGGGLEGGLDYKGQSEVRGGVVQPETVSATVRPNIADATPNRNAVPKVMAEDAGLHGRAGGARYGAAGAAVMSLGQDAIEGHFNADDAQNLVVHTAEGAAIGQADTMLAGQIAKNLAGATAAEAEIAGVRAVAGMASAGVIGAVVGGGVAAWQDADKVEDGTMSAGDATADVAVSAGVGLGAGLAGAAAGAAVGSIIPVAGTAVGAVVGFGVGMLASVGATMLAEHSGLADAAREELGQVLTENFEAPLQEAWHAGSAASDAVGDAVGSAAGAVGSAAGAAGGAVAGAAVTVAGVAAGAAGAVAGAAADVASTGAKAVAGAAGAVAGAAADVASTGAKAVAGAAGAVTGAAADVASTGAKAVAGAAGAVAGAAADVASTGAKAVAGAAGAAADAASDAAGAVADAAGDVAAAAKAALGF